MKKLKQLLLRLWNFLKNPKDYFDQKKMERRLEAGVVEKYSNRVGLLESCFTWLSSKNKKKRISDHHNTMLARKKFGGEFKSAGIKDVRIRNGKMEVVK